MNKNNEHIYELAKFLHKNKMRMKLSEVKSFFYTNNINNSYGEPYKQSRGIAKLIQDTYGYVEAEKVAESFVDKNGNFAYIK